MLESVKAQVVNVLVAAADPHNPNLSAAAAAAAAIEGAVAGTDGDRGSEEADAAIIPYEPVRPSFIVTYMYIYSSSAILCHYMYNLHLVLPSCREVSRRRCTHIRHDICFYCGQIQAEGAKFFPLWNQLGNSESTFLRGMMVRT